MVIEDFMYQGEGSGAQSDEEDGEDGLEYPGDVGFVRRLEARKLNLTPKRDKGIETKT